MKYKCKGCGFEPKSILEIQNGVCKNCGQKMDIVPERLREGYGNYLTGKRIEKGLTLKKLAEITGIPERNLFGIETERVERYSLRDLRYYLKAIELPMDEICEEVK